MLIMPVGAPVLQDGSRDQAGSLNEGFMAQPPKVFDRRLILDRRARYAGDAADHSFLLDRVAEDFFERLQGINRTFRTGVVLGAYDGTLGRVLRGVESIGVLFDAEASPDLLQLCDGPRLSCDEEAVPFGDETVDLFVSGLSLQFVNDLPGVLVQLRRALKPDGLLLASLVGGESLRELREAWVVAEDEVRGGASPRVAPFVDVRDLGGLAQRAGFALPVVDTDQVQVTYASPLALMRDLKFMGASNALVSRSRKPVTGELLARACEVYEERFSTGDGAVVATFDIVTLTAWAPHESQQKPLRPGSATTRLADALDAVSQRSPGPGDVGGSDDGEPTR